LFRSRLVRLGVCHLHWCAREEIRTEISPCPRKSAPSERVAGIELRRPGVGLDCLAISGLSPSEIVEAALQQAVVGFKTAPRRAVTCGRRRRPWQGFG